MKEKTNRNIWPSITSIIAGAILMASSYIENGSIFWFIAGSLILGVGLLELLTRFFID